MHLIRVFVVNKQSCQYWYILGIQTSTLMHLILGMLIFMLGNGDVFIFFLEHGICSYLSMWACIVPWFCANKCIGFISWHLKYVCQVLEIWYFRIIHSLSSSRWLAGAFSLVGRKFRKKSIISCQFLVEFCMQMFNSGTWYCFQSIMLSCWIDMRLMNFSSYLYFADIAWLIL